MAQDANWVDCEDLKVVGRQVGNTNNRMTILCKWFFPNYYCATVMLYTEFVAECLLSQNFSNILSV